MIEMRFSTWRIVPVAFAAVSVLTACEAKYRPNADPEALAALEVERDAGRQTTPSEGTPAIPATTENPAGTGELGEEALPVVDGIGPDDSLSGQTNSCSGDAGACLSLGDAGAIPSVCVPTGPRDCTSDLDNDCNGQPDNVLDEVCLCAADTVEPCEEHPGLDGRGQCVAGTRTCLLDEATLTTSWGTCDGAVGPGATDSCTVAGDDTNCDGIPNGDCACVDGETQACGPATDQGICQRGTSTCVNGRPGDCVGAVFAATRNCGSPQDNDCDGRPDDTIDNTCTCAIGSVQACGTHPGDGNGQCRAGSRTCQGRANNSTSGFGDCTGSVGPAARDTCAGGNDANCNGVPNEGCGCINGDTRLCGTTDIGACAFGTQTCGVNGTFGQQCVGAVNPGSRNCGSAQDNDCDGEPDNTLDNVCECIPGQGNAPCSDDPNNSRCNGQGQCAPCQSDADCSLVSGDRNTCDSGSCVESLLGVGESCAGNADCASQDCRAWFPDLDGDGLGVAPAQMRCGDPTTGFATTPGDCCDLGGAQRAVAASIFPGQRAFFDTAQSACPGLGAFNYDCVTATSDQFGISVANGVAGNCGPNCDGSGWVLPPACGAEGTLVTCSLFMGFCSIVSNSPTARSEVRECH
jgi:hypothetical protein